MQNLSKFINGFLRSSLLNEDDDFSHLQQQIYDKGSHNDGELYKREIQEYLKALKKKFNIVPKQYLGSGNFGYAFLSTDGHTIKITQDKSEVVEAKKWKDTNPKHLPKVFNIIKIKVGDHRQRGAEDAYVIVKEHILQNPGFIKMIDKLEKQFEELLSLYHFSEQPRPRFPNIATIFFHYCIEDKLSEEDISKFMNFAKQRGVSNYLIWYVEQIVSIYKELRELGIQSTDTYGKNLGIKNKQLIYIDPGFGDFDGKGWIEKEPYGAAVAQENIQEDDVLNKLKSDIVSVDDMDNGKIHDRDISKFLELIKNNLNLNIVKFLGKGAFGYAFLTDDGKTVKLTRDTSEAVEGNKIRNSNAKHLPKIYNILKIKVGDDESRLRYIYIIVKDHILQNNSFILSMYAMEKKLEELYKRFLMSHEYKDKESLYFQPHFFNSFLKSDNNQIHIDEFFKFIKQNNKSQMLIWYAEQYHSLCKEMKNLGIRSDDVGPRNLGIKNKTLILLDVGSGDYSPEWIDKEPHAGHIAQESKNP